MKPLSEHAHKLVESLQQIDLGWPLTLPAERRKKIDAAIELIHAIEETNEWTAIPYLCSFLTSSDKSILNATASAVEHLISKTNPKSLMQLDEQLRRGQWNLAPYLARWDAIRFKDLEHSGATSGNVRVIGMASFHRNGHVRESAVAKLSSIKTGEELPFIIIRLADWVEEVRQVAEAALSERINAGYVQHLIANLPLLELMLFKQRAADSAKRQAIIQRITDIVNQPAQQGKLLDGLRHQDLAVRRECIRLIQPKVDIEFNEILAVICSDKDLTNRRAAVSICITLSHPGCTRWLTVLLNDHSPRIRRDALVALIDLVEHEECEKLLRGALIDPSAIVREFARWKLEKRGFVIDLRQFYTSLLESQNDSAQLAIAIAGLSEVGNTNDAKTLMVFLQSKNAHVRESAIRAIARLDRQAHIDIFVDSLTDQSSSVSKAAAKALEGIVTSVSTATLWRVFNAYKQWHIRRNALRLLNQSSKWERISYLLAAAAQPDPKISELALLNCESWAREFASTWNYSKPKSEEMARIELAMNKLSNKLPVGLKGLLAQCLNAWQVSK